MDMVLKQGEALVKLIMLGFESERRVEIRG